MRAHIRILIVDDEQKWRDMLGFLLSKEPQYHITAVASKQEAAELLRSRTFHVLIVDMRLNDAENGNADGLTLLKMIRSEYPAERMQAIMLTGYGTLANSREAFTEYGVTDFIDKGDESCEKDLRSAVRKALTQIQQIEEWRLSPTWRIRTFSKEFMTKLARQLRPADWSQQVTMDKLALYLSRIVTDYYLPLSVDVIGPVLIGSEPPISRLVCWSRANCEAISIAIQLGPREVGLAQKLKALEKKWEPVSESEPVYDDYFSGILYKLKGMRFEDFVDALES
jgi:CheY-like chemotaxis protein